MKHILNIIYTYVFSSVFFIFGYFITYPVLAQDNFPVAKVQVVYGDVAVCGFRRGIGMDCIPAHSNMDLFVGEILETKSDGYVRINYNSNYPNFFGLTRGELALGASTSVKLGANWVHRNEQPWPAQLFNLISGTVRGILKNVTDRLPTVGFSARASCTVASEFIIKQTPNQVATKSALIAVREGNLRCRLDNGETGDISSGELLRMEEGGFSAIERLSDSLWSGLLSVDEGGSSPIVIPSDCKGKDWGKVKLSGGGTSWSGTYTNGYSTKPNRKEYRMGELTLQYDWATGIGSGTWGQPYIGRGGKIEKIKITTEPAGVRFKFIYYTTVKGNQERVINRLLDKPRKRSGFFCSK